MTSYHSLFLIFLLTAFSAFAENRTFSLDTDGIFRKIEVGSGNPDLSATLEEPVFSKDGTIAFKLRFTRAKMVPSVNGQIRKWVEDPSLTRTVELRKEDLEKVLDIIPLRHGRSAKVTIASPTFSGEAVAYPISLNKESAGDPELGIHLQLAEGKSTWLPLRGLGELNIDIRAKNPKHQGVPSSRWHAIKCEFGMLADSLADHRSYWAPR